MLEYTVSFGGVCSMKKLLPAYILCLVFCFMLFIYEPIMMYANNMNDFWFNFNIMIKPVLELAMPIFLIGIIGITFIYLIIGVLFKKVNWYYSLMLIIFFIFFITYIEGNYLVGRLPGLDGSIINWSKYQLENYITLGVSLLLLIIGIISIKKCGLAKTINYAAYISLAILLMLGTSFVTTLNNNKRMFNQKNKLVLTFDNINTASKNKNYYIVLLDAVDSGKFYQEWQSDSQYKDLFDDFTFYNDALAYYPFTLNSIPLILTGEINRNEKEYSEFATNAYNNSPLFKKLIENNYHLNLYDRDIVWNGNKKIDIDNNITSKTYKIDLRYFFKQELKYVMFKYLPFPLKKYSKIETFDFEKCIDKYRIDLPEGNSIIENNPKLEFTNNNEFKYLHLEGGHAPFNLNENLEYIENGMYVQKVHGNLKYVKNFLDRLKRNNVYDNSVIIIMADHGYGNTNVANIFYRMNPLLIIKGMNEHHEVVFSDKAISYEDINKALVELVDGKKSADLFQDIPSKRKRTVLWYHFTKENHMVEYTTEGKASDITKFKKTGRVFDRKG